MTIHVKSAIIVLITLLIGILIGALGSGALRQSKMRELRALHRPMGFVHLWERIIEPTEAQQDTVHKILVKYSERFSQITKQGRMEMKVLVDSMRMELQPLLTKEQKERLSRRENIFRHRRFHEKGMEGRPPFMHDSPPEPGIR